MNTGVILSTVFSPNFKNVQRKIYLAVFLNNKIRLVQNKKQPCQITYFLVEINLQLCFINLSLWE